MRLAVAPRSASIALALIPLVAACDSGTDPSDTPDAATPDAPGATAISPATQDDLIYLREEEKLARDVYLTLYDRFHLPPHTNIATSEQTHMDRVAAALTVYGLPDPIASDTVGSFTDPTLATLYAQLVAAGEVSPTASLVAGATIEDLDLADLAEMRAGTTVAYVLQVYDDLACGSRNHLRTFYGQLASLGETYAPQYITADQLAAILASGREPCGR